MWPGIFCISQEHPMLPDQVVMSWIGSHVLVDAECATCASCYLYIRPIKRPCSLSHLTLFLNYIHLPLNKQTVLPCCTVNSYILHIINPFASSCTISIAKFYKVLPSGSPCIITPTDQEPHNYLHS